MTEYREVQSNWFKATKIGDYIEGTLIGREKRESTTPEGVKKIQDVFELLVDEGKFHNMIKDENGMEKIDEANPVIVEKGDYYYFAKDSINRAMTKIKNGQKVKFVFDSVIPSKDRMRKDFKLVKVYAGPMDNEYLASEWGEVPTPEETDDGPINVGKVDFNN